MATPTDSSFGSSFDAAAFRDAITSTMEMGLPTDESERVTFRFSAEETFETVDSAGHPFDYTASPTTVTPETDVQVPVAVEFEARPASSLDTSLGQFDSPRGTVTILDTYYPDVEGADLVIVDGKEYTIEYWLPPVGLFDVTIYQCIITARDV